MKRLIVFISVLILIISCFAACSDNKVTDKSETKTFTTGREAVTSSMKIADQNHVFHRDSKGNDIRIEHFNSDNQPVYSEEPVYDNTGTVSGCKYYDKNGNMIGSYELNNHFYDNKGKEITEDQFAALLRNAGINN